jgi:hypothetical protein
MANTSSWWQWFERSTALKKDGWDGLFSIQASAADGDNPHGASLCTRFRPWMDKFLMLPHRKHHQIPRRWRLIS